MLSFPTSLSHQHLRKLVAHLPRPCSSENIARIALAVDYTGNGYRSLLPMALREPAVLNAALAVAASHHSRWQHTADNISRKYLRAASKALRDRFLIPDHIHSQVTLAAMLLLVSFEVWPHSLPAPALRYRNCLLIPLSFYPGILRIRPLERALRCDSRLDSLSR